MKSKNKPARGGYRPGAGRKPKAGKPRDYTTVRILREAYETIPDGVNKCDYVSAVLIERAGK